MDLTNITLASLLSPGGIAAAAAITYFVIALAKANLPVLDARVSGALQSTIVLAALYAAAFVSTPGASIFQTLMFFLMADGLALGIDSGVTHLQNVGNGTAGVKALPASPIANPNPTDPAPSA